MTLFLMKFGGNQMVDVFLDSREPSHIEDLFFEFFPQGQIKLLETGDLVCESRGVCCERKTIEDFKTSVMGSKDIPGRFFEQIDRMEDNYPHNYVLIVGRWNDLSPNDQQVFTKKMYRGVCASIMARNNVKIFTLDNNRELFQMAKTIFEKSDGVRKVRNSLKKASKNDNPVLMGSLFQVPKIGTHQCKTIIESLNIKSVCQLCRLHEDELLSVDKIGMVKASEIKKHFKCEKVKEES